MSHETYLGQKGYSIYKKSLNVTEQIFIREELTVKPYIPKSPVQPSPFPVYLESTKKFYIPRVFGINTFGIPNENRVEKGDTINIKFNGELRQPQQNVIDKYIEATKNNGYGGLLDLYTGFGKTVLGLKIISELKVKTLIIVHKGFLVDQWIERIQQFLPDARIGKIQGQIIDIDNKDIVLGMLQSLSMKEYPEDQFKSFGLTIVDECFPFNTLIHTNEGPQYIGDLYNKWERNELIPEVLSYNILTQKFQYKNLTYAWRKVREELINIKMVNNYIKCTPEHKILTISGYKPANLLVVGDIILNKYDITNTKKNICRALNEDQLQLIYGSYLGSGKIIFTNISNRYKLIMRHEHIDYCKWKAYNFQLNNKNKYNEKYKNKYNEKYKYSFTTEKFDLPNKFHKNKNIIPEWLIDNLDPRGIAIWYMDSGYVNSCINENYVILHAKNFGLNMKIILVNKFKSYNINCMIHSYKKNKSNNNDCYLSFNKENSVKFYDLIYPYIINIPNLESKFINYFTQSVQSYIWNSEFLNYGTNVVTKISYHKNECCLLYNKAFVYDIEVEDNHNFIIARKNNCLNKNIIDGPVVSNCHHISAEIFVRALQKVVTQYTLGLSATMNRKDGLTKVFKLFLGEVIHKEKRDNDTSVIVKAVEFNTCDDEFNEVKLDYRGNPQYSTMITKLCVFNMRSELIINIIISELKINDNQQIMILAHNKSLLTYLYKAIEYRKIASVGYYVGGMKQADLKISETKKIVIATYSMASEGLDIKTLTTLILATPKTDIEQAVGRIMRVKHNSPLIIDIIDSHDIFKRQWLKRKTFYQKNNYKLMYSSNYKQNKWEEIIKKTGKNNQKEINNNDDINMGKCLITI